MNLLLDTHIALWAIAGSPRLPPKARALITAPDANIWVSAASLWEIAIKHTLGRGDMPVSGQDALHWFLQSGYRVLPIEAHHAVAVEDLPAHHSDPFDRILIAQAVVEPMRLLTHDPVVALYGGPIVEV